MLSEKAYLKLKPYLKVSDNGNVQWNVGCRELTYEEMNIYYILVDSYGKAPSADTFGEILNQKEKLAKAD